MARAMTTPRQNTASTLEQDSKSFNGLEAGTPTSNADYDSDPNNFNYDALKHTGDPVAGIRSDKQAQYQFYNERGLLETGGAEPINLSTFDARRTTGKASPGLATLSSIYSSS